MDLIPSRTNTVSLQADQAGVYRGECAEFCGLQHAHMGFLVVAQSQGDFNTWLAAQQQPATPPADPVALQGQRVFLSAGCVFCHTVRGLDDKSIDLLSGIVLWASLVTGQGPDGGWFGYPPLTETRYSPSFGRPQPEGQRPAADSRVTAHPCQHARGKIAANTFLRLAVAQTPAVRMYDA